MSLQTLLASFLMLVAGWLPAGARALMVLLHAMVRNPWFSVVTGIVQLGMGISALIYFWPEIRRQHFLCLVPAIPAALLGFAFFQLPVPDFVTGVVTVTVGILFLVQSRQQAAAGEPAGLKKILVLSGCACLGVIPGAGVLSMVMMGDLLSGQSFSSAYKSGCLSIIALLILDGVSCLTSVPSLEWVSIVGCMIAGAFSFLLTPVLLRFMITWFREHTLLVFGIWRIFFGIVFLLVFCVL